MNGFPTIRARLHNLDPVTVQVGIALAAISMLIYGLSASKAFVVADSNSYIKPAYVLLHDGYFESIRRLPGYPLFLVAVLYLTGSIGGLIIIVQTGLLFGTGLIARRITEEMLPGYGNFVMILVCFNPPGLYAAQVIWPDNMFAFFFILHSYFMLKAFKYGSMKAAAGAGVCAGLFSMLRAEGQFLIYAMPVLLFCSIYFYRNRRKWRTALGSSVVALILSFILVLPWLLHNYNKNRGFAFTTKEWVGAGIGYNVIHAIDLMEGLGQMEATEPTVKKAFELEGMPDADPMEFTPLERWTIVAKHYKTLLFDRPLPEIVRGITRALANFYLSNGPNLWTQYFFPDHGPWLRNGFYALAWGFIIVVRVMGLLGLFSFLSKCPWPYVLIFVVDVIFFTAIINFCGHARYRLPVDPILFILAAWGLMTSQQLFWRMRKRQ